LLLFSSEFKLNAFSNFIPHTVSSGHQYLLLTAFALEVVGSDLHFDVVPFPLLCMFSLSAVTKWCLKMQQLLT